MDATGSENDVALTVVLNAMGRLELAELGFRSWMLQQWDRPYQIVLSLFNDQQPRFEALTSGKSPNCNVVINSYPRPEFFNISAANNLGLHFATGEFVLFANSDIIYPSGYGRRFTENMRRARIGYAVGSRYNLTEEQTASMSGALDYTSEKNFDFLDTGWSFAGNRWNASVWPGCGPWMIRRDVALAIGGFDPAVLCSEDDDFSARAVHFLARRGEQDSNVSFLELLGYHLYHPTSELFDYHFAAHQIIDARRDRLRATPQSVEDVVPNRLDDLSSLAEQVQRTKRPPIGGRYRQDTIRKIGKRLSAAAKVLIGRR